MAVIKGMPFISYEKDRAYGVDLWRKLFKQYFTNGVFNGGLEVKADTGLNITVSAGTFHIDGTTGFNDELLTLEIQKPSTQTIMYVVGRVNDSGDVRASEIDVLIGTSEPPAITRDETIKEIVLAVLTIPANTTTITNAMIDNSVKLNDELCGIVATTVEHIDTDTFYSQIQADLNEFKNTEQVEFEEFSNNYKTDFEEFSTTSKSEFENWFNSVKENLLNSAPSKEYRSNYTSTTPDEIEININIDEYVSDLDTLNVYINGFKLIKDIDYTINLTGTSITLTNGIDKGTRVDFEVIKTASGVDLTQKINALEQEIDDLKGYVGYTDDDIYGVEVDFKNNIFTRLAGAKNLTEGADFDIINAYNRRRCILNDNGDVIAYYGDSGYIEDGSVGQVMVEQPKFYYKVVPLELEPITDGKGYHLRKARYYICDTPKYGFKLHPAFIKSGVEKDKIYLSAYEGSIYDTSANKYLLNDEQVADFNTDKLCSIINAKPSSGITQQLNRQNTRKLANNRGNGWGIFTIQSIAVTQILSLIEYASFNMQEKIGIGVTNKGSSTLNISENTGVTSVLGNKTGSKINQNGYNFISYRGEENIFSNQWGWVDGMNIYNYDIKPFYISDHNFEDNIGELPYKEVGFNLQGGEGYISAFGYCQDYDWLFIPTEFNGNSALPVGDYVPEMMNKNNWTGVAFGGSWGFGDKSGLYCYTFHSISKGSGARDVSNRLLYIPQ